MTDPYTSFSTGKLKLKGVKDSKISKKKKDKSSSLSSSTSSSKPQAPTNAASHGTEDTTDTSVVLKHLVAEDAAIAAEGGGTDPSSRSKNGHRQQQQQQQQQQPNGIDGGAQEIDVRVHKTEAERKWEDQRRKRLEERLKREGVKSHKERVQELNKYLSGLSEHHDMPKIGPG